MINQKQYEILKQILKEEDSFIGFKISPTHLAMDDDGDLRSYIGEPVKYDTFWGDMNTPPYDTYDNEIKEILNFIKVGHSKPFNIKELIIEFKNNNK